MTASVAATEAATVAVVKAENVDSDDAVLAGMMVGRAGVAVAAICEVRADDRSPLSPRSFVVLSQRLMLFLFFFFIFGLSCWFSSIQSSCLFRFSFSLSSAWAGFVEHSPLLHKSLSTSFSTS